MPLLEESLAYAERAGKHSMQILVRLIAAEDAEPGHELDLRATESSDSCLDVTYVQAAVSLP